MLLIMFSVYDSKAEAFLPPFFAPNDAMAQRMFASAANDQEHAFGRHAGDYTLFRVGEWNDADGIVCPAKTQTNLGLALTYLRPSSIPATVETTTPNGADLQETI